MTIMTTSLLPQMTGNLLVAPNVQGLSDQEQGLITGLSTKLSLQSYIGSVRNAYYNGLQRLQDLGVSIPPQMAGVRTVVDWPRICVDPLVQRSVVDGFRMPGSLDVDEDFVEVWQANDMDAEAPLCFLDSLVYGRGYMVVGSPDSPGDPALITVESPLNLAMNWDPRTRTATSAYQAYEAEGIYRAALYLPNSSIFMSRDSTVNGSWTVDSRDNHNLGEVCVVRFPNRQRTSDREGTSEITPAIMNTTDSACRSLLGMEIAREFYSIPHRYILGASESDFQNADGTPKTALSLSMNKYLALERDEEGNLPEIGQFTAFDPSVFTKIIDKHAQLMASYTGFPPAYFGQTTTANPASADAIRVSLDGIDRRGGQVQDQFSTPLQRVMQLAWRISNNGADLPADMKRLKTQWIDASTQTPEGTTDAIQKQVMVGSIPPTSSVTLKKLGYTALEREQLAVDRQNDAGASVLAELATSLQAKEARTDIAVAADITGKPAVDSTAPATPAATPPVPPANGAK